MTNSENAQVPSKASHPVRAGNAFFEKFGSEPRTASDCAWLNGYVAALEAPDNETFAVPVSPHTPTPDAQLTSNERLTADDAHDPKKCELLDQVYRQAYDEFAGPVGYRHAVNFEAYKRAGLIAIWNAAQDAIRSSNETCSCGATLEARVYCPACREVKPPAPKAGDPR